MVYFKFLFFYDTYDLFIISPHVPVCFSIQNHYVLKNKKCIFKKWKKYRKNVTMICKYNFIAMNCVTVLSQHSCSLFLFKFEKIKIKGHSWHILPTYSLQFNPPPGRFVVMCKSTVRISKTLLFENFLPCFERRSHHVALALFFVNDSNTRTRSRCLRHTYTQY